MQTMRALSNSLCTVRSTVLVLVLFACTFLLFDSYYNWRLVAISWSQPDWPFPSQSETSSSSVSKSKTDDILNNVRSSDVLSEDDYEDDESEIPNNKLDSPQNESIPGLSSQPTDDKQGMENGPVSGNYDADSASENSGDRGPGLFPQDGAAPHDDPTVNSRSRDNGDEAKFTESVSGIETAPSFKNGTDPTKGAVTPGPEKSDSTVQMGERSNSTSWKSDAVAEEPQRTTPPIASEPMRKMPIRGYEQLSSLQKVELDLWQARSAMRKVVVAQMDSTNDVDQSVPDGEPFGDVYRNAAIFRQSYQEMEQRFKVYAYQEGEEPLVHNGPCKEIYAVEGRFIQELQGDNPFVTTNPEEAHVFFLPFSVAMMVTYLYTANSGDRSPLLRFVKDYIHVVSHKYPYWTRSEGADHFMLSCHDWGPHVSRADKNLVSRTIRVLCNANISEGYVPNKDASLPEIHLVGGYISAELGGLSPAERPFLAFFAGGDHGPVRPKLFKNWEGKDGNIHVYHQVPAEGLSYHEYMKSSKYCLCPGGFEVNSPRIVEAIYNDCVPVVIADDFVLPFSDVLDWKVFAVHVLEKDIPNLKTILEAIPMETYIQMQARVKQVQHHFLLNQPPKRYDAFHMILHSVWLRRLNIRVLGKNQT